MADQEEKKETLDVNSPEVEAFGKQLLNWLYSDKDYAHRLDHENSGNW